MRVAAGVVAESVVRGLGPLPRQVRLFNRVDLSAGARRVFLSAGVRGGSRSDNVVDNDVSHEGPRGGRPNVTVQPDRDWYRLENNAGAVALHIYDEIGYWGVTASALANELRGITATSIDVHLNSPGGEIFDGIAIYNALRSHPAAVTVTVEGLAASIASVIAQAGDRIVMAPHSQLMIHDGSGLCMGNSADMQEMADLLNRQSDNIAGVYAERAGGDVSTWRAAMLAETWYTAEEAVAAGLADEVSAPARQSGALEPEPAARWNLSVFKHAGRENAPAPVLNTAAAPVTEPANPEPSTVVPEPQAQQPAPEAPAVPEPVAPEPTPEPNPEPVALAADAWASLTTHLTATPSWDDVTASLREASQ